MITVNIDKAKTIAHDMRRAARDAEFTPHDKIVALNIPGSDAINAEAERVKIREKYKVIQATIDAATTADEVAEITTEFTVPEISLVDK